MNNNQNYSGQDSSNRRVRPSFSEALSVSLGLHEQGIGAGRTRSNLAPNSYSGYNDNTTSSVSNREFGRIGRSYAGSISSNSPSLYLNTSRTDELLPIRKMPSKSILGPDALHRQTAEISNDFNDTSMDEAKIKRYIELLNRKQIEAEEEGEESAVHLRPHTFIEGKSFLSPIGSSASQLDGLEQRALLTPSSSIVGNEFDLESTYDEINNDYNSILRIQSRELTSSSFATKGLELLNYLPAAILGLLLNILDALSYGMIIFPITEPLFSGLGPTGISMFYISTIVCQLVLSGGFSSFPCGIGSEMIEITPFYHTMAFAIKDALPNQDNEVITTTIFCYVISSVVTGLVFFMLGKLKMGKIVGFFPRHILIGCIGGVGYFLIITGIEVSTRIGKFEYNWEFLLSLLTNLDTLGKWLLPTLLTLSLILIQRQVQNSLVLPSFYILTIILFHFIVAILPNLSLDHLRENGWIFPVTDSKNSWYDHYKYFNLHDIHWGLVLKQIPTMLALTFFGILHVPINVPALAMSLHMDKYDVDRELIAHGYSNLISGLLGSVQNYLVYTNSVLFIRAGADSSSAGFLLVALTVVVMVAGSVIVSFIPVCIVGSLIFLLGYELMVEALVDTIGTVTSFEYITILIIVFIMGIYDFVLGIIVGILIACLSFMVDGTKLETINGEYDGQVAKSTVYRDYIQTKFLNGIRQQIYLLKLQNVLFFGTIISIEEKIDKLLEISDKDPSKRRIKYLILDFKNINADNIDYSAAEGFNRIKRFTQGKRIQLIISSIKEKDKIYSVFNMVRLLEDVELFDDLNSALEWCENEFLYQYMQLHEKAKDRIHKRISISKDSGSTYFSRNRSDSGLSAADQQMLMSLPINTPRNNQVLSVARKVFKNEAQTASKFKTHNETDKPVLSLLLYSIRLFRPDVFSEDVSIREKEINFWGQLSPYFRRSLFPTGSTLVNSSNFFFVVESGVVRVTHDLPQGIVSETMSNRTCYGKVVGHRGTVTNLPKIIFKTETESIIWMIDDDTMSRIKKENLNLYTELLLLVMTIREYRYKGLIGYTLVSA
ncbi:hypothetical protein Kpol_480p18 [Vanderwaltozyma polyspora DSM 70294]|uniref:STAS domain-containing protein n=1 Tax=Vanderwaltozyma polyspora (strain ATCC 22028 / DSM 70294 / BCRC 21397 / CBS 2163 / NBRC 10782 / NRRL Y-8283 / UCD 57-17) TaxID=436907 RepID=A7TP80_VANPO|nr:uncharacterized protein Kpol_480p18 [Vanderwaltozyma polyspora DSM 70294]EDO15931.1 hypothetical protein Kpol_480p18 [Vanderwaltozyma polyspora DSM 70294]